QMNVRSSTRATSLGSEAAQYELGLAFNGTNVPASTSSALMRSASSSEPSTHTTRSGVVSSATSRTQESTPLCVVGALSRPGMATAVISTPVFDDKTPHRTRSGCGLRCRDRTSLCSPQPFAWRRQAVPGAVPGVCAVHDVSARVSASRCNVQPHLELTGELSVRGPQQRCLEVAMQIRADVQHA